MSELRRQDLATIERHLRRIAEALERMSPPPTKEPKERVERRGVVVL